MKFEFSPHVAFQVKNYKEAVSFYKDVLGMEVVTSSPGETHMKCGPVNFYVENSEAGNTFFEFKVESVAEAKVLLENNGCRITHTYNDKSVMFQDPYGMRFHIWEE